MMKKLAKAPSYRDEPNGTIVQVLNEYPFTVMVKWDDTSWNAEPKREQIKWLRKGI